MTEPAERIVNLALFLAAARVPVSAERIRAEVPGYPKDQDETAFLRMFERDKERLRAAGLVIDSTPEGAYRLDTDRTFAAEVTLSPEAEASLRVASAALLADPAFPFGDDLRYALAKITSASEVPTAATAHLADERPSEQGAAVVSLSEAISARKLVSFDYINAAGQRAVRTAEPFGLFLREGRWYLVGRDTGRDETRVYAVSRMNAVDVDLSRPKTPDFEVPEGFDVSDFIGLPFQYGSKEPFEATLSFGPSVAWRTAALVGNVGVLQREDDRVLWRVSARSVRRLLRWVIANGPGIEIVAPPELAEELHAGLAEVADLHA